MTITSVPSQFLRITAACKRGFDIMVAGFALLLLSPVLLLLALVIVLDAGWSPLFRQVRIGRYGREFRICKFRTMVNDAENKGAGVWITPGDDRFTRTGPLLRKLSLDELPQFWNVLVGDMSLVGPRPIHPTTLPKLTAEQRGRHRVRPGITGWAVIHGRNSIPYSQRFQLDNWYIDHWSFALDVRILLATVPLVILRKGMTLDQTAERIDDLKQPEPSVIQPGRSSRTSMGPSLS
jgi:lipopolysaccharide/colanic/teichoic acid biosynthesis glycosyltransferase